MIDDTSILFWCCSAHFEFLFTHVWRVSEDERWGSLRLHVRQVLKGWAEGEYALSWLCVSVYKYTYIHTYICMKICTQSHWLSVNNCSQRSTIYCKKKWETLFSLLKVKLDFKLLYFGTGVLIKIVYCSLPPVFINKFVRCFTRLFT